MQLKTKPAKKKKKKIAFLPSGYHLSVDTEIPVSNEVIECPEEEHLKPFNECGFEEITYYYVWVSCRHNNPPFKAVIYTGFASGSYRSAFTGGDRVVQFDHRARFKIITKIGKSGC